MGDSVMLAPFFTERASNVWVAFTIRRSLVPSLSSCPLVKDEEDEQDDWEGGVSSMMFITGTPGTRKRARKCRSEGTTRRSIPWVNTGEPTRVDESRFEVIRMKLCAVYIQREALSKSQST